MTRFIPFRARYRKKIDRIVSQASDEGLFELIWAIDALQSDRIDAAAPYLDRSLPREAATSDIASRWAIFKWELETLANEALVSAKAKRFETGDRLVNTRLFETARQLTWALRKLENAESGCMLKDNRILREMVRIANRQFAWQRGYHNVPQFYRNAFVYGQGACAAFFKDQNGITVNDFSLAGYAFYAHFAVKPVLPRKIDGTPVGLAPEAIAAALTLIARPLADMKQLARAERAGFYQTAYRPSVLRQFPCTLFGDASDRVRAPLPQLILERTTNGVFYDVVGGGGTVRADYGRRFEEYALAYLRAQLPEVDWQPERQYKIAKNQVDTPDILQLENGVVPLAIECKATRMGYGASFGSVEIYERGFEDLIKAVFQLWRFFSHCRRGLTGLAVTRNTVGAVLTLDGWLTMANPLEDDVLAAAEVMAIAKDPLILQEDRRPIAFIPVTDMETTLRRATPASFLSAIRRRAEEDRRGYMLVTVHDDFEEPDTPDKPFPFITDVGRLLPWWDKIDDAKRRRSKI